MNEDEVIEFNFPLVHRKFKEGDIVQYRDSRGRKLFDNSKLFVVAKTWPPGKVVTIRPAEGGPQAGLDYFELVKNLKRTER
jgi:hypothetical protein